MKNLTILFFFLLGIKYFSQNIKCETANYLKKLENTAYSTFEYINSSYSYSRPLIVLVANKKIFNSAHNKIPSIFSEKQEYTDLFFIGIENFNYNNVSEIDKKIITECIKKIMKYRNDNDLIKIDEKTIWLNIKYLNMEDDLCKYLSCRLILKKKKF